MVIKEEFYFTPRGVAEPDCAIHAPDYGNPATGFGNSRGIYRINLTVPASTARSLVNLITKTHKDNWKVLLSEHAKRTHKLPERGRLKPYEGDMPFFENDDGTVTFRIKRYAASIDPRTQESTQVPLKVVDSQGKRIENVPTIAGGSELKVRFSMFPYGWSQVAGASVKLKIESVMLIKLAETCCRDCDDVWCGEVVEGGYEVAEPSSKVLL